MEPGLLLAMPYGVAADRYGRVPIFFLSYLGQTLGVVWYFLVCKSAAQLFDVMLDMSKRPDGLTVRLPNVFPIEAIYVSSAFYIIGGGAFVFNAITYTYLADIFPAHERHVYPETWDACEPPCS